MINLRRSSLAITDDMAGRKKPTGRKVNPCASGPPKSKRIPDESLALRDVRDKIKVLNMLLSDPGRTCEERDLILLKIERLRHIR